MNKQKVLSLISKSHLDKAIDAIDEMGYVIDPEIRREVEAYESRRQQLIESKKQFPSDEHRQWVDRMAKVTAKLIHLANRL